MKRNVICFLAVACSLLSSGVSALTWQPIGADDGSDMRWRKLCSGQGASATWLKVGECQFQFSQTISGNTANYNIENAARAAGWNGNSLLKADITINSDVIVYSSSAAVPAFYTGSNIPAGSQLSLINNGRILGMGGAGGAGRTTSGYGVLVQGSAGASGGAALGASFRLTVTNYGTIAGGGGGGGGGGSSLATAYYGGSTGRCTAGGGGGSGGRASFSASAGGAAGSGANGSDGSGSCSFTVAAQTGQSSSFSFIGAGGNGGTAIASSSYYSSSATGGKGGTGGDWGQAGANGAGASGFAGGAAGPAVLGLANVTWAVSGQLWGPLQ